jgi:glycosyltransferase involved in cell wall biosynthesis
VAAERDDVHLVLVGGGGLQTLSCERELREYVTVHGLASRVTITGYVDNVPDYLHTADVFVLPSESEAFPLSLLEAIACGLQCIASRTGGIVDVAAHATELMLVEPRSEDDLYRAIGIAATKDWTRQQEDGMRREVLRYGMNRVATEHLKLFVGLRST